MICLPLSVILIFLCRRRENGVPAIPINPPSLLPFFCLGLGPTNLPQQLFIPHCWEPLSPFPAFFPRQTPITKFPRLPVSGTWGFPLTRHSPRQCASPRGYEYGKMITFHGPPVFHGLIQSSVHPPVLCHSVATLGIYNGSQRPDTES